ncbi:MAG TPA: hypothetical protein VIG51_10325 [Candidatus Baltobacteraceae bacterium]|jgi:hypothetical protein
MKHRVSLAIFVLFAFAIALPATASAHIRSIDHGGTYWGDVSIEPNQVVNGDVDVIFGDARIEGTVNGNVNVFGGEIEKMDGSVITGQENVVGGGIAQSLVPWIPAGIAAENSRMLALLAYSAIIVLMFLIFPVRVRVALDRVEQHPGLSAAVGIIAIVAVIPIAILLLISVVGWPLIPLELLAVVAGVFIGQAALGLLVGRRLWELIRPHTTPSPLAALVLGLFVLSAAEIVPVVGHLITALVALIGLGATILGVFREIGPPGTARAPRAPISGPPMNPA